MNETLLVPGGRDVRATLDRATPSSAGGRSSSDAVVVACPPHPQHGGHRGDERLVAVSDGLADRGIDCLRFDYGPWDEGYGESTDADNAVGWALDRYDRVGLFGFSFGGCIALVTAADRPELSGVCALAPAPRLNPDVDAVAAIDRLRVPARVVYGTRDTTAEWKPVVDRARERGVETVAVAGDHFFVGRSADVAVEVVAFLAPILSNGTVDGGE